MNLGLVTGEYPPMEGGVGAFTQELSRALAAAGHTVHIFTHRKARPPSDDRRLSALREPVDLDYARLHPRARRWRWGDVATVADLTLRHDLDVLNIQYQAAAYNMRIPAINLLPWRLKGVTTTVVTFHDLRVPYLFPKAGRLRRAMVHFMARHAHGVIVTNGEDDAALEAAGIPANRRRQIPIGSNITAIRPAATAVTSIRRELGVGEDGRLLGYFGFLNESKGADTLLEALAALDESTHLAFIGGRTGSSDLANNAAFYGRLDALITRLGLDARVHWTGFVDAAQVSAYLHAADLMVMPYRDGVSLRRGTLMAALAHGRPLITTTPARPIPELSHGDNVWLVPPDEPAALAVAIRRVIADPALCARLGAAAETVAGRFTWDKIAAQTVEFYAHLRRRAAS